MLKEILFSLILSLSEGLLRVGHFDVKIEDRWLKSVEALEESDVLNLSGLHLLHISESAFSKVEHIKSLDLSNNLLIDLEPGIFLNLSQLEHLSLANNGFQQPMPTIFKGLSNLKTLNISGIYFIDSNPIFNFHGLSDHAEIFIDDEMIDSNALYPSLFGMNEAIQIAQSLRGDFVESCEKLPVGFVREMLGEEPQCSTSRNNYDQTLMICFTSDQRVEKLDFIDGPLPDNCESIDALHYRYGYLSIILDHDNIKGFEKNWFRLPIESTFTTLTIQETSIEEIDANVLNDLPPCITSVIIKKNKINTIKRGALNNSYIRYLALPRNNIDTIEDGAFENMKVTSLNLEGNLLGDMQFISTLPSTVLSLFLSNNIIIDIPDGIFSHLPYLMALELNLNSILEISKEKFDGLRYLQELQLHSNGITEIKSDTFDGLPCAYKIDVSKNEIQMIEKGFVGKLQRLSVLDLYDNRLGKHLRNGIFYGMPLNSKVFINNVKSLQPGIFKNY